MKIRYIRKLHSALVFACPEGYSVTVARNGAHLFTMIACDDPDYFAPWASLREILTDHGF